MQAGISRVVKIICPLPARRSACGSLFSPIDYLGLVRGIPVELILGDIEGIVITAGTAGVMHVPPALIIYRVIIRTVMRLGSRVWLIFRILPVAGIVQQDAGGVDGMSHCHLPVVLVLRDRAPLVMQIVDYQAGERPVALYHTGKFLVTVCKIETALHIVIVEPAGRILVSTGFFPDEKTKFIGILYDIRLTYHSVEIEHIETEGLG